jgi:drug/metabolite transporter (DMT)-like permease
LVVSFFFPVPVFTLGSVLAILVLGLFQVGLASVFFASGIKRVSAVGATLIAIIEPVCNPIWVFLAVGEAPGPTAIIGGAVIVLAVCGASIISARRTRTN